MLLVALLGTGLAAFGPIYLALEGDATLAQTLRAAVPANVGVTLLPTSPKDAAGLAPSARALRRSPIGSFYTPPIRTRLAALTTSAHGQPYVSTLVSRTGVCRHLHMVAGHCPTSRGGVAVSDRSARLLGWTIGTRAHVDIGSAARATVVVEGLYAAGSAATPYWWGQNFFGFGTGKNPARPRLDDVFASARTISALPKALAAVTTLDQFPLRAAALPPGALGRADAVLARLSAADLNRGVRLGTQLPRVLAGAESTERTAGTIVSVVDLELVLFAVFVLYFVASRTAADREPDVRLAALRGYRPSSTLAVAMSEPVAIVLSAVPAGVLCAWGVASAIAPALFGAGLGAPAPLAAFAAALAAGLAGLVATAVGTAHVLTSGVDAPVGSTSTLARHSVARVAAEVFAVGVAAAALFELAVTGVSTRGATSADVLSALAPGLVALGAGVIGARVLPIMLRWTHRRTAYASKLALSYSARRVARRSEFSAVVLLGTLGVGLAAFSVSGWAIAARNRNARSAFDVGAPTVLTVSVPPGVTFLRAVRGAEHGRHDAMAAVVEHAASGTTLAVDPSSMASVVSWPPTMGIGPSTVARRLVPLGLTPPVVVAGRAIELEARARESFTGAPPQLALDVYDPDDQDSTRLTFGAVLPGVHTYRAALAGACPGGCRLTDVAISWTAPRASAVATVALTIRAMRGTQRGGAAALHAGLTHPGAWTASAGGRARPGAGGLAVSAHLSYLTASVLVSPHDVPTALPAVVTPMTASSASGHGGPFIVGLNGATVPGHTVAEVASLPAVGADATLVDLEAAERLVTTPFRTDTTQVWLSAWSPPSLLGALEAAGLSVLSRQTASARVAQDAKSGVGLAFLFFLLAGFAAAVLLLGAACFAVVSGARRKQGELAVMRVLGVGPRKLRRLFWTEQVLAVAAGAVIGAGAGIVAAAVGMRSVPEFAHQGAGPPLSFSLPVILLAGVVGAIAVALALVTWLGASLVAARATLDKLWEGEG
jgi:putative ABC transport system permease protein